MYFGRGKRKIIADYTSKDVYDFYKQKVKDKAVSLNKFNTIWKRFIDVRLQMVIYENIPIAMPYRLGEISVRLGGQSNTFTKDGEFKFKTDWGETKKKWKKLYPNLTPEEIIAIPNKPLVCVENKTTDGKKVYFRWDRYTCNHKNYKAYRIKLNKKWSHMLAQHVKQSDKIQYYESTIR